MKINIVQKINSAKSLLNLSARVNLWSFSLNMDYVFNSLVACVFISAHNLYFNFGVCVVVYVGVVLAFFKMSVYRGRRCSYNDISNFV